jgi:hypothetical protein
MILEATRDLPDAASLAGAPSPKERDMAAHGTGEGAEVRRDPAERALLTVRGAP